MSKPREGETLGAWLRRMDEEAENWRPAPRTVEEVAARLAAVAGPPWTIEPHGQAEALYSGRHPNRHGLNLVTLSDWDRNGAALKAFLTAAPEDVAFLLAEVRRLQEERDRWEKAADSTPPTITQRDYLHMAIGDVSAALKLTPKGPAHHTLTITLATLQAVLESRQPARREGP